MLSSAASPGLGNVGWIKVKRALSWAITNADALIALILAVLVSILNVVGAVSARLVGNATVATLAVLAFVLLRDRGRQDETRDAVGELAIKFDTRNPIRSLAGESIGRVVAAARQDTEQWFFRGATATYVRVVTLPECVKYARRAGKELRVRLEILDPTNNVACENYIRLYRSLAESPASPELTWTVDGTRVELYATILAACWHKQRYEPLTVEISLSALASTFRWEVSSQFLILTQRGPRFPAMLIERGDPYYDLFASELNASFRQARKVPVELAADVHLSDDPTIDETRMLFSRLGLELSPEFADQAVSEIVAKALRDKNPYADSDS